MKSIFEQMGGTYTQEGDYLIPNLSLPDTPYEPIGKYGRMRQAYLKEHRPGLYSHLILSRKCTSTWQKLNEPAKNGWKP